MYEHDDSVMLYNCFRITRMVNHVLVDPGIQKLLGFFN